MGSASCTRMQRYRRTRSAAALFVFSTMVALTCAPAVLAASPGRPPLSGTGRLTFTQPDPTPHSAPAADLPPAAGAAHSNAVDPDPPSAADPSTAHATARVAGNTVSSAVGAPKGTQVEASATCPEGTTIVQGGGIVTTSDGANSDRASLTQSYPSSNTSWTAVGVVASSDLSDGESLNVTAIVLCS